MMFSAKFFTVVAALFAVAVNGSVVGFAERGINDVRSLHGPLGVDGCEI